MGTSFKSTQTYKNIFVNILVFGITFLFNMYTSPIIVGEVGTSAYGFVGLANDFISYAAIIVTIFNSVASRFIANSYYKKNFEKANNYFNSLFVTNFVLAILLAVLATIVIFYIQQLLSVPSGLVADVRLTFTFSFGAYIIGLLGSVFTIPAFVSNRTDIKGARQVLENFIKFTCVIFLLKCVSVKLYWVSFATIISTVVAIILNINLKKFLTPELKINLHLAKIKYAFDLAKSGCWMAFTSISNILTRGLDLTIANAMMGSYEMGILSIARTVPNCVTNIISTLAPLYTPTFISSYSKGDFKEVGRNVKKSISVMATILYVPITCFVVFSYDFYALWQNSLSPQELIMVTILSNLTIVQAYFNLTTATMAQLSLVVNKLNIPVIMSFTVGILSIVLEFILLIFTKLGLYSIVISTTVIIILRYIFFNPIYAAYCINQNKSYFVKILIKTWLTIPLIIAPMIIVRVLLPVSSWIGLILNVVISCVIGYLVIILLLNRNIVINILKRFNKKKVVDDAID